MDKSTCRQVRTNKPPRSADPVNIRLLRPDSYSTLWRGLAEHRIARIYGGKYGHYYNFCPGNR